MKRLWNASIHDKGKVLLYIWAPAFIAAELALEFPESVFGPLLDSLFFRLYAGLTSLAMVYVLYRVIVKEK